MKRSVRLLAGAIAVAAGLAAAPAVAGAAVAAPGNHLASTPGAAQGKQITLGAPRTVNVKALSGVPAGSHPRLVAPFLSPKTARAGGAARRSGVTTLRAATRQAASAPQAASTTST